MKPTHVCRAYRHASDYREVAMNLLAILGELMDEGANPVRENPHDIASLLRAIQYLSENADLADEEERAQIAEEAQRLASAGARGNA